MPTPPCAAGCPLVGDLLAEIATLTGRSEPAVRWAHLGGELPAFDHHCPACGDWAASPFAAAECADQDQAKKMRSTR
jgi:hypothetical protein